MGLLSEEWKAGSVEYNI